ncbi:hypothetical protein [Bifidobacterium felsineum]|uniref:hypothetical protein n=1 Tax=Bifidobacterium felsineum TaxID=2045440 RepID=UPI001BDD9F0B|nr:hypothetical protein [Bifidobacterium felsineum]MBT1164900.1 hypothetical protein [Bifidobacterium felsineum]
MNTYASVMKTMDAAKRYGRCMRASDAAEYMLLRRMKAKKEIICPYPNMYIDRGYWSSLSPPDQMLHIMRTLSRGHPDMVFAGISAACAWELDHSFHLHAQDNRIMIAASSGTPTNEYCNRIRRFYVPRHEIEQAQSVAGVKVTTIQRTLFDCGRIYEPRSALSFYDSAIRQGLVDREDLAAYCNEKHRCRNQYQARALAVFANGLSENGGESFCYGTMAEEGVTLPEQQVQFVDKNNPNVVYRVDYLWRLSDGTLIAGEFDGQKKYMDPLMTNGQNVSGVVGRERSRQNVLAALGVSHTVRWFFNDAYHRLPMKKALAAAGVPIGEPTAPWIR